MSIGPTTWRVSLGTTKPRLDALDAPAKPVLLEAGCICEFKLTGEEHVGCYRTTAPIIRWLMGKTIHKYETTCTLYIHEKDKAVRRTGAIEEAGRYCTRYPPPLPHPTTPRPGATPENRRDAAETIVLPFLLIPQQLCRVTKAKRS